MLNDLLTVGSSVLTLLLLMAVGFILAKCGMLANATLSQLSKLLLSIVAPAIMIDTFLAEECDPATLQKFLIAAAVLVGTYVLNMVLTLLLFRRKEAHERGVMRFASIYGNTGFMGIPLIQAALGAPGMLTTVVSLAVFNISTWTHGNAMINGKGQLSAKKVVLNPAVIGFVIAMVLFFTGIELPVPLGKTVTFVGSLNTPLAMIIIGGQMAAVDFKELFRDGRVWVGSALKLLALPVLTMLILLPLKLDPIMYTAVVILAACPVAGATSLFCQMGGKDTSLAARLVTLSTIFSVITLPVMATVAKFLAGATF